MKKVILLLAFSACLAGISFAQNSIPQNAKDHFVSIYPMASNVKWDVEGDKIEVKFELNGAEWDSYYNANGNWLKTKRELKNDEVPLVVLVGLQAVLDGLKATEFGAWSADDPHEYQIPTHKSLYRFEIKNGGEKKVIFLTPEGMLVPEMTKNKE